MSGRPKYLLKAIVGETQQVRKYSKYLRDCWVLECGHIVPKHKPESLADAFRLLNQEIRKREGEPVKARCYECAKTNQIKGVL